MLIRNELENEISQRFELYLYAFFVLPYYFWLDVMVRVKKIH